MMENLVLVGAPDAGLHLDKAVPFAELSEELLVLPSPRHGLRKIMDECARDRGFKIATSVEADSFGAMIDLVRHGFGFTALPLASIYAHLKDGTLCAAPLIDPTPMRKLVLVSPADRHVSPATRYVGETFVEIASELVGEGIWAGHML
ncbi:LysR substrate binding domain protein [compost metagenome]